MLSQAIYSQTVNLDSIHTLEIKKIEINNGLRTRVNRSSKKENDKIISIKCIIRSNDKDSIDINAFSLIDTENKVRYRLSDYQAHKGRSVIGFGHTHESYLKSKLVDKKGKPYKLLPKYDPSKKDSFNTFKFEGYENCETRTYFGTNRRHSANDLFEKQKRLISVVYYPHSKPKWEQFVCFLSFPCLNSDNQPKLELYYGNKFISKIRK
ncbi:hypothetical protein GCM10022395_09100 [Snuella lapsa]|uniref:Uncharacterized protein n=2 Tax=Snuella lapsa TaxID=870481 RepID=A0ABP6X2M7_9FLAO